MDSTSSASATRADSWMPRIVHRVAARPTAPPRTATVSGDGASPNRPARNDADPTSAAIATAA